MNIIKQRLSEFEKEFAPKIIAKNEGEQLYADMMAKMCIFQQVDFLKQSMLLAMESVLREVEIKTIPDDPSQIDEYIMGFKSAVGEQKTKHQEILNNYRQSTNFTH